MSRDAGIAGERPRHDVVSNTLSTEISRQRRAHFPKLKTGSTLPSIFNSLIPVTRIAKTRRALGISPPGWRCLCSAGQLTVAGEIQDADLMLTLEVIQTRGQASS